MTLRQFLTATADAPDLRLRQAIVRALTTEAPYTPEAYRRFYRRVVEELEVYEAGAAERVA